MPDSDKLQKYVGKTITYISHEDSLYIQFEDGSSAYFVTNFDTDQIKFIDEEEEEIIEPLPYSLTPIQRLRLKDNF